MSRLVNHLSQPQMLSISNIKETEGRTISIMYHYLASRYCQSDYDRVVRYEGNEDKADREILWINPIPTITKFNS